MKKLCLLLFTLISAKGILLAQFNFSKLDKSAPILIFDKKNIVIQNLSFTSLTDNNLTIAACENVTIRNCYFGASKSHGISIQQSTNVKIENCFFANNKTSVHAQDSKQIKVLNNQFLNVHGDKTQQITGGNFIQFNQVSGEGNEISGNKCEAIDGETDAEDLFSIFHCNGTPSSPILIKNNILKGGGPSQGGGSIQTGDGGGSYILVDSNTIYHPAGFGIAASGGTNIVISNNKIILRPNPTTWHTAIYVADYSQGDCNNITIKNNQVNYNLLNGFSSPFNNNQSAGFTCSTVTLTNNLWTASLDIFTLPSMLLSIVSSEYDKIRAQHNLFN